MTLEKGWLLRQLDSAMEDIRTWPEWMKREAGINLRKDASLMKGTDQGQDTLPAWRRLAPADRTEFQVWVKAALFYREQLGEEKYHSREKGFQGDPFDHLEQEIFDALFYLWVEKRRQGLEGNDPESRIYRAVQLLLEGTYYDHEERVTIDGKLFRMNAIRTRKQQQGDGPISMNIRLTHIPHEEPEEDETEEESSESCLGLGMIFLEQGTTLYLALIENLRQDGHTRDCETVESAANLKSSVCSTTCYMTAEAIETWEEKRRSSYKSKQRLQTQSVDHADALVKLTQDEADRLDGQSHHEDNDE